LVKIGADYSINEDWNRQIIGSAGSYYFPSLTTFAEDFSANTTSRKDYTSFTQAFGQPIVDVYTKRLGVHAQDTWKPLPRLTVVAGVVWEKTFIPQPKYSNVTYFQTLTIHSPSLDFSPRIGAAYDLDSHTTVRASAGTFYQPLPGQLYQALYTGNGIYQLPITVNPGQTGAPVFPKIIASPSSVVAGMLDITYGVNKLHDPFLVQGTFSIERKLGNDWTLSLNYLYNRGTDLWVAVDQNLTTATVTKAYPIDNAAGSAAGSYSVLISATKSNTNFAHVYQIENEGASWYNGAAIQLRKRMAHGLAVQASYTWSHALDDVGGPPAIAGFVPTTSITNSFRTDKGDSSFDQRNRVILNWTWQPRPSKSDSFAARYLINGWQLSGIATLASSLRETPIVIVNSLGVTTAYPTSVDGSGGWSRVPFEPVNSLLTGPQYTVDARLTRELPFTERIRGQLMFEAFNAFNSQFNTSVNTIAYQITSGVFHPVPGAGVGNSAEGYPWGDNARHLQVALRIVF
ncbi:MAG: TonB-dependent receptor, partial [Bryobacteraceae bacterium]